MLLGLEGLEGSPGLLGCRSRLLLLDRPGLELLLDCLRLELLLLGRLGLSLLLDLLLLLHKLLQGGEGLSSWGSWLLELLLCWLLLELLLCWLGLELLGLEGLLGWLGRGNPLGEPLGRNRGRERSARWSRSGSTYWSRSGSTCRSRSSC